ncbi:phosphoserine phosphatase [Photobacterium leiognathi]|uniref:Phosphoserine phosphatase n=1 Tax=Photobacterium leiognathi TaxID=553611 RepID=A0A2T3M6H2_PHOLE|nr:phosphoserine phosphatase [Photobacterium leiognathi]KJF97220.1 phosphoserine phosphatase [Photobacterium leiognathi]PSV87522.1 phosphoserine phosphatase [Photobacterium leiognathi]
MDVEHVLKIKKHPTLYKRFPQLLSVTNGDKRQARAMFYGKAISHYDIESLAAVLDDDLVLLASWKVGSYDVFLIANDLTEELEQAFCSLALDYYHLSELPDLTEPGLVVFDMDSTAIEIECIDEIAKLAGVGEQVAEVTERAMQGELDFEQSLRQRVGTLAGADESILAEVKATLPFMPELREVVANLHARGWKVAIASGGFTYFSDHLKQELDLVAAFSNQLEIIDGKLTGKVLGDVVDAQAKANILQGLAEQYDIEPHNTVAVGDGANDLVMMKAAGLGIAYHAKPKVEQQAPAVIRYADLGGILCILSASLVPQRLSW